MGVTVGAAVADLVAFGFAEVVALAVGFAVVCVVGVDEALADADGFAVAVGVPVAMPSPPTELVRFGGVIAKTAPRPPKVPPAIRSERFISYPLC